MSGFPRGTDRGPYELTATKARYWHRHRRDSCRSVEDMMEAHVAPMMHVTISHSGSYWTITDSSLEAGSTNPLYEALSGCQSFRRPPPPGPPGRAVP